ncbi:hypothetical protein [Campylobacter sputorum]|uniref:hypothetical protein n=1 Tax=Campylobacter sputorum TaxID=206 RepID=UPI000B7985EE|nr:MULTISPECIES: hypothetical protein [Campylobacter]ASM36519.1 hypothetical protein CSF_0624 [Campylobacter sputorum bv. faecalis CCUG 20703]ASM38218.1 hypothetical protein CSPARA_0630 [Campylobacter sputorum bv. paraureolyticus LMG 11764]MBE7357490.1 hypothetical protein [Campylobacter sp. RM11302]MDY6120063.1 hypothetical protein [Campylobacter sputorum]
MVQNGVVICNVCGVRSDKESDIVYILATKNGEKVDICTSCMPSVIHGSGLVVKSNDEIKQEFLSN